MVMHGKKHREWRWSLYYLKECMEKREDPIAWYIRTRKEKRGMRGKGGEESSSDLIVFHTNTHFCRQDSNIDWWHGAVNVEMMSEDRIDIWHHFPLTQKRYWSPPPVLPTDPSFCCCCCCCLIIWPTIHSDAICTISLCVFSIVSPSVIIMMWEGNTERDNRKKKRLDLNESNKSCQSFQINYNNISCHQTWTTTWS